jgi:hypothetical protein
MLERNPLHMMLADLPEKCEDSVVLQRRNQEYLTAMPLFLVMQSSLYLSLWGKFPLPPILCSSSLELE